MSKLEIIAHQLLDHLFSHRRQMDPASDCHQVDCQHCRFIQQEKIASVFRAQQPLTLILPAFPAKSVNRNKTISHLPDLGEHLALKFLNQLCADLSNIYTPGVKLIICSDGRVFNDLVNVPDAQVEAYQQAISEIIRHEKLNYLSLFSLDDCYIHTNYPTMRQKLVNEYGETLKQLSEKNQHQLPDKLLFNGIHRFVFEDQIVLFPDLSRNKIRIQAKKTAYEVIQRSNAWSRLLAEQFPASLRLSIHPQTCGSEKLGIQLLTTVNPWATPWHNVVLKKGDQLLLVKQCQAKELGATFVMGTEKFNGHYVI